MTQKEKVTPYGEGRSKKEEVAKMFDNISGKYDFLNHFFSMGIDILWRKKLIRKLKKEKPNSVLDIATGTGDLAIEALKAGPQKVTGSDISEGMLKIGREKLKKKGLEDRIDLQYGDSENLPFESESFDAAIVAFGVRNFENLEQGLKEMNRVLRKGGTTFILEFSKPSRFPIKQLYNFYFKKIMPLLGKSISRDSAAYSYLPESVSAFPEGKEFKRIMERSGFSDIHSQPLTFGIATIYFGRK